MGTVAEGEKERTRPTRQLSGADEAGTELPWASRSRD